jgi:hypothetical protein
VGIEKNYEDWEADARALYELAQQLLPQSPKVQVRLRRDLADRAVAAWQRDEVPGTLPRETPEQRSIRGDAGTLALIGQSIEDTGIEDGDDVTFGLDAWILGVALEAGPGRRVGSVSSIGLTRVPPINDCVKFTLSG